MTWVRFDDLFPIHRKVAGLDDAAYRLHTEAIFWCVRNGTDGVIRKHELGLLGVRAKPARVARLVEHQLWHRAGELCARCQTALAEAGTAEPTDGWALHDLLDYQPSRAKVAKERAAKAERQSRWLDARRGNRRSGDASHDASKDDAPFARDANPAPPRPEGSGAGPRGSGRRLTAVDGGGGRREENPDWRTMAAFGAERDPTVAQRALRGAAAAREALQAQTQTSTEEVS